MKRWGEIFSGTGTVLLSLLSCSVCPMCLPIYAGILSLVGVELSEISAFFFPVMIFFSVITLSFMGYQIYKHHGSWKIFSIALASGLSMISAAFLGYEYILYASVAFFIGSIFWNKRTLTHHGPGCC